MKRTAEALTTPVLITENSELIQLCDKWNRLSILALDTEFIRIDTFFPKLGLIQVCDDEGSFLLDPVALTDWSAFISILSNSSITKVLHSCSEDLVVFKEFFGHLPSPVFDTQKAAAFLGFGYSISYQNLVKEILKIELSKGETRSDWLRRPLSEEQCKYAALDVAYLPEIYRHLRKLLCEKFRLDWFQEECAEMVNSANSEVSETSWESSYQNIGTAWKLDDSQLAILQRLCIWREREARKRDKPRSWIAKDSDLFCLAERTPQDRSSLLNISELSKSLLHRDSDNLLEIIKTTHLGAPLKLAAVDLPLSTEMRGYLKKCQAIVQQKAHELNIAPEMLARKKQLLPLVIEVSKSKEFMWPESLSGWRQAILETAMRQALC